MRGKIDLSAHRLADVFRPNAKATWWKRTRPEKMPDAAYRQIWRVVDGAVRDTFENHPEYLTAKGRASAVRSVTKRVTGAVHGYAAQAARGRSETRDSASCEAAADRSATFTRSARFLAWLHLRLRHWRGAVARPATDSGARA